MHKLDSSPKDYQGDGLVAPKLNFSLFKVDPPKSKFAILAGETLNLKPKRIKYNEKKNCNQ